MADKKIIDQHESKKIFLIYIAQESQTIFKTKQHADNFNPNN